MGYIFLCFALMAGLVKGYCGKRTSGIATTVNDAMVSNFIRMLFCILTGFALIIFQNSVELLRVDLQTLMITLLSGFSTSVFVVSWLLSVRKGAYMVVEVFLMMGVLIPIVIGKILFDEPILLKQYIGIGVLILATIIMCMYNNKQKGKITVPVFLLLCLCGTASGFADFSQKLFVRVATDIPVSVFNLYTYIFSAICLLPALFIGKKEEGSTFSVKKIILFILIMSVCLFANSYFKTQAAVYLDSATLYPLNQGAALILSSAMSAVCFKEKLTVTAITGLIVAFIGLIIINL